MSIGALFTTAGNASAYDTVPIDVGHWVGLYYQPTTSDGKIPNGDLPPGGAIIAKCWTVGQSIGNYGDTWYETDQVNDGTGWGVTLGWVYVFAGYADGNARSVNRDPNIPQC
ncbi:hypothetical protein [Streptomyces sp. NPDC091215]|uniref:hypothetical protein n=1 Tax=Streptomyces sp. NPDC091215 TaxID=3155192 RepID=UPI003427A417